MHLPAGLAAGFAERFQEAPPIQVVFENRFPPVAPVHQVIDRAGILDSQFSPHTPPKIAKGPMMSIWNFYNGWD
jgi:hypothetical protein